MKYTIRNEKVELCVDTHAAEMHSFRRTDNQYEYLWQGDKEYWAGRNPVLFPQVSSTKDKKNIIYGKEYPMGNHGFARNSEFTLVDQDDDSLTLVLEDNEETIKQYPYSFSLYVNYRLVEESVVISYRIVNRNDEVMPFGFGLHPAFNCPKDFVDTYITFDEKETLEVNNELFEKYHTYKYDPNPFKSAVLNTNGHHLRLDFEGYDILAVWSPFAPFVCIEPWITPDPEEDVDFEKRRGMVMLKAKEEFKISYSITLVD